MHSMLSARHRADTRSATDRRPYALGYSPEELQRLRRQAELIEDLTEDVMQRAGLAAGMRVLDIGCGVGDVSLLAAQLVGPDGAVLGIDRSAESIDAARCSARGNAQVAFTAADVETFSPQETFDALIGRLVLMYLPDPAATLRRLARHLRPGGVVAFQEMVMPLACSLPEGPLFTRCRDWIVTTFQRGGFAFDMGGRLPATFRAAGLPAPQMIAGSRVEGGRHSPVYDYVADTLRSLLPMMERHKVATAAEVDVDTLAERLRQETVASNGCIMLPPLVGAWCRTVSR